MTTRAAKPLPTPRRPSPAKRQRRARRSKIAHLPPDIRAEIVGRLREGHSQKAVLKWLNAEPRVKAARRRETSAHIHREIRPANLSLWLESKPPEATGINLKK